MKHWKRFLAAPAILAVGALALSGCSAGSGESADGSTTLTFWHNSTTGEGKAYWEDVAAAFEADNPGVKVEIEAIQNEEMDGKLQTALSSGDAPDVFLARGGGKLEDVVEAGQAMDLTEGVSDEAAAALGSVLDSFKVDDKVYGMPVSVLPSGIFYSSDLFTAAGVTEAPSTIADLESVNAQLASSGVAPIAVGAKDAWPAAHWYYNFALRACSKETMDKAGETRSFDDPCWLKAGEDLQDFIDSKPFNEGFLTTAAQQGAGSSAGLVANKKAAMELMGAWDPGVIASLTPDAKPLADLSWFPFPEVSGGDGAPGAMMGGVDGYTCWVNAPKECIDFLNFMLTKENQEAYAAAFQTIPASQEAQAGVTDPALQDILATYSSAPYVVLWLDTQYGQNIGNALNGAVVDMFAGQGSAEDLVAAVNDAAAKS